MVEWMIAPMMPLASEMPTVGSSRVKKDIYVEVQIPSTGSMVLLLKNSDEPVGEVPVEEPNLIASVRTLTNGDPSIPVVISADKIVLYEQVMGVMNQLKSAGIRKVGLLVKKPN